MWRLHFVEHQFPVASPASEKRSSVPKRVIGQIVIGQNESVGFLCWTFPQNLWHTSRNRKTKMGQHLRITRTTFFLCFQILHLLIESKNIYWVCEFVKFVNFSAPELVSLCPSVDSNHRTERVDMQLSKRCQSIVKLWVMDMIYNVIMVVLHTKGSTRVNTRLTGRSWDFCVIISPDVQWMCRTFLYMSVPFSSMSKIWLTWVSAYFFFECLAWSNPQDSEESAVQVPPWPSFAFPWSLRSLDARSGALFLRSAGDS